MPRLRAVLTGLLLGVLLVPALLLTGLRLVQPGAGWAVRTVSFAPFAVPLYLGGGLVLMVLVVGAVRARAATSRIAVGVLALLVSLVLLGLHVSWLAPAWTGTPPAAAAGSPRLRVLTLNVLHGAATAADVSALVERAEPDVVVLQEVTPDLWRDLRRSAVRTTHPHVAGLKGHAPGTVVLSRRPVGPAVRLPTVGDCLLVGVQLGERTVELLAVHPRYPERPAAWREDHAAIAAAVRGTRPALVVGDFNATYDHGAMHRYRTLGYRSAAELLNTGWSPTWPVNGHRDLAGVPLPSVVHIDHVMVARGLTALTVEHLDVPGTDHRAVVAEVAPR